MSLTVTKLVGGVAGLPEQAKRRISAVIGALVADAASLPLEWIYKDETMREIVGDKQPEFWPESKCPFYSQPTGSLSCYGDELVTSLSCLASSGGQVNIAGLQEAIFTKFGSPESPYQIALAKRADKVYPVAGPWINGGVIKSLANIKEGVSPPGSPDCEDNDGFALSLPVFLLQADQAKEVATIVTTSETAVRHLAVQTAILGNFLVAGDGDRPVEKALEDTTLPDMAAEGKSVLAAAAAGKSVTEMVEQFGKACGLPGSFQGALASLVTCDDFVSAVRKNILAGGDCNARAIMIGSCLGARLGVEGIPMEWIEKVHGIDEILQNAVKVFAASDK